MAKTFQPSHLLLAVVAVLTFFVMNQLGYGQLGIFSVRKMNFVSDTLKTNLCRAIYPGGLSENR
jgi:hypothetical protein